MRHFVRYVILLFVILFFGISVNGQDLMPDFLIKPQKKINTACQLRIDIRYETSDAEANVIQDNVFRILKNDNNFLIRSEIFDCMKNEKEFLFINHQFQTIYFVVKDELTKRAEEAVIEQYGSTEGMLSSFQFTTQVDDEINSGFNCTEKGDMSYSCRGQKKGLQSIDYKLYDEYHVRTIEIENPGSRTGEAVHQKYTYSNYDSTTVINGDLFLVDHYLELHGDELKYILDPNYTVEIKIQ